MYLLLDRAKLKHHLIVVAFGILLYLALTNLAEIKAALDTFYRIGYSFFYGLIIAYLLNIPYTFYREKLFYLLSHRGGPIGSIAKYLALLLAYLTVLILLALFIWIVIPQLVISVTFLVQNIPYYIDQAEILITRIGSYFGQEDFYEGQLDMVWPNVVSWGNALLNNIISNFVEYASNLSSSLFNLVIAIAFSVYFLSGKEWLLRHLKQLVVAFGPRRKVMRILQIAKRTNRIFTGFIAGNILDSLLVGFLCFLGMSILGFPFPLLISIIIGVTNLIPIIGPFIGAIPGGLIILTVDPLKALFFLLFILVLQQVDGNVFKPRIFGDKVGLPSVWVLLSIVVFGGLFGIFGMLIGVPAFAVLFGLLGDSTRRRLAQRREEVAKTKVTEGDSFPIAKTFARARGRKRKKESKDS